MGKVVSEIDERLARWLEAQPLWFVASAPLDPGGHCNISPKGGAGLFRVLGDHRVAYVDLFGSGIETVAHLRENGRIVVMFAAFDGAPDVVRLHGRGRVVQQHEGDYPGLLDGFELTDDHRRCARSIIDVEVRRISRSCGFVVPEMRYEGERQQLYRYAADRVATDGPLAIRTYCDVNNAASIDGLTGLDAFGPTVTEQQRTRHDHRGKVV
ncbi:MAG: pyridoxamine 5'-phosphate oxidase family protein [Nitriliruptoraceae bacterium]|nr:pyridoxamine 5'-phosphate oxidase family protein [Nitriliruptoraceae bacterium]